MKPFPTLHSFISFEKIFFPLKIALFSIFSLFGITNSSAQTGFAPAGAIWHYTFIPSYFSGNQGYVTLENIGDTVINSIICKVITYTEYHPNGFITSKPNQYLSVSGDTVSRYADDGAFYVLYNFAAEVGDSWPSSTYDVTNNEDVYFQLTVDEKYEAEINGQMLRHLKLSCDHQYVSFGFNTQVIELLGGVRFMFPFNYAFLDYHIPRDLRCYEDDEFGFYDSPDIMETCDTIIVTTHEPLINPNIKIWPNPSTGHFNIGIQDSTYDYDLLKIYSSNGQLIHEKELDSLAELYEINVKTKGVLIVKLIGHDGFTIRKVIIP